ncbi:MAG: ABC transporter permease [Corynebacterium sp.]|nr:ABC transporter permease [Corynebacterium sp.]
MIYAELLKLKRAQLWVVAFILPLLAVVTGTANTVGNAGVVSQNWEGLMSQITLFYGLFFCAIGISVMVAAGWRMEHRGNNWNQVHTTTSNYFGFMMAKVLVLLLPVAGMNVMLLVLSTIAGKLVAGFSGMPPWYVTAPLLLTVVAAAPLVALQSLFSSWFQSFGVPVGLGLLGVIAGFGIIQKFQTLAFIVPHAFVAQIGLMGSIAVDGPLPATADSALKTVITSVIGTLVLSLIGSYVLRWRKTL